jgi:hypothetical protein
MLITRAAGIHPIRQDAAKVTGPGTPRPVRLHHSVRENSRTSVVNCLRSVGVALSQSERFSFFWSGHDDSPGDTR